MRKILQAAAATTAVMMALGGGAAVRAEPVAPTFDDTAQYTAELNYQDDADGKEPVTGANFSYYKVGWYDMDNTDGNICSNLVSVVPGTDIPSLIDKGQEEQETQVRNLAKEVQDAYQGQTPTHGKEFDVTTDSNGTALTQGMPQGVYLAVETEAAPLHFASAPFLFSLPYMTGGSGKASIKSPAKMKISNGFATATIEWSSSHYDYMVVNNIKYEPVSDTGNSVFEIPITKFDGGMEVIADTTAMSEPHEITYTLNFKEATTITANTPVFIHSAQNKADGYTFTGVEVKNATPTQTADGFNFVGTYTATTVPVGNYFINSSNKFFKAGDDKTNIKGTRATFEPVGAATSAKGLGFNVTEDGTTTAINSITMQEELNVNAPMYNLAGQQVTKAYKGVILQNGKKFINK